VIVAPKHRAHSGVSGTGIATIVAVTMLTGWLWAARAQAMSAGPHHSFLGGPWELVVKMGLEGEGLRFPITVPDETKPHKFGNVLPVMGTPISVRLEDYVPDLGWESTAVKQPGAGAVARITVKGKDLEPQTIWLNSADLSRQSMSSSVGGVAIRKLHDPKRAEKLIQDLTHSKAVGILSVWSENSDSPFECVAKVAETVAIPQSKYKLTVLEYVPHYSIDTETKKVTSQSDKPINPAIRVEVSDGAGTFDQWLWAKFASSPHEQTNLPLRMRFAEFDLRNLKGRYIIVTADGLKPRMLFVERGKKRVKNAVIGNFYPFADADYSFGIELLMDEAIIRTDWKNNSERLLRPAVVATIEQEGAGQQTVLELNKPFHHKTRFGTLVLLYKRALESPRAAN